MSENDDGIPALEPRDALHEILKMCESTSTGDLDDPVERIAVMCEKSLAIKCDMISSEKRERMNQLYFQAIYFRRAVLEMLDGLTQTSLKDVQDEGKLLDSILSEINGGKLPYHFETAAQSVCATAALLAGG